MQEQVQTKSIEQKTLDILKEYKGSNNYILKLRQQQIVNPKFIPTRAQCDYVNSFYNTEPKVAKKWVEIDSYFAKKLVDDNPFIKEPDKIYVEKLLVEKDKSYHIWGKVFSGDTTYDFWIPKTAIHKAKTRNVEVNWEKYSHRPPLNHQKECIVKLLENDRFIVADDMGLGKALEINTIVYTPYGPKKIGDIKIGDEIFGNDGLPYKVTGVFPQGVKNLYRVTFNDGYSVLCCEEHIWNVSTASNGYNNNRRKILNINLTTKQLIDKNFSIKGEGLHSKLQKTYYKINRGNSKWQIPITQPVQFNTQELPLDPYLLGLILGDGGITNESIIFSTKDEELINSIKNIVGEKIIINKKKGENCDYGLSKLKNDKTNYLVKILKKLKLQGCRSYNKFIPDIYKYNTVETRLSVLQGLMDTDGTCYKSRKNNEFAGTEFSTISEKLADDVVEIVQSLGGIARKKSRTTTYTYNGEKKQGKKSYRINIKLQGNMNPFRLKRKKDLYREPKKYKVARYIKDIQFERLGDSVCISINSPNKLYVTEHFIVTHNTTSTVISSIESESKKILIICPASLKINWKREIALYSNESIFIVESKKWEEGHKYYIINYDIMKNFHEVKSKDSILNKENFDLVVIDEAHYISNPQAQRTKIINDLVKNVERLWLLTGTPMTSRPMNYYNLLNLIESPVAANWMAYAIRYCGGYQFTVGKRKVWNVNGATNLEELRDRTSRNVIRRLKTEVLDLPEKIITPIYQRLHSRLYEELMGEYYDWYTNKKEESKSLSIQFSKLTKVRQVIAEEKIQTTIEVAENIIEQGKKVIIFSNFTEPLQKIHEHFKKQSVYLDGSTSKPARQKAVDDFQENEKIRVFCGNIKAAGVGITLTAAEAVIMNDLSFLPSDHAQAEDRSYRYGQKNNVLVYYPLFENTLEMAIYDILSRKKQIIGTVMGDMNESETDVVEQILKEISGK